MNLALNQLRAVPKGPTVLQVSRPDNCSQAGEPIMQPAQDRLALRRLLTATANGAHAACARDRCGSCVRSGQACGPYGR